MASTPPVVRVEGGRQLRAALRDMEGGLVDLRKANAEAATVAARAGAGEAPRRSGQLAASIRPGATQSAAIVRAGSARVPYAGVIEYGWAARHIAPHPFLRTGAEHTQTAWLAVYRRAIDRLILRVESKAHP